MKSILVTGISVLVLFGSSSLGAPLLENLAYNASGSGTLPAVALDQGTPAGIFDGSMFAWLDGATSPRRISDTNLQPFMTWSSDQTVRSVRVWFDTTNTAPSEFDRLVVDTLKLGGSATTEADWVTRHDTGSGFAKAFLDVDLGVNYTTRGLRVRAFKATQDINVGEVSVFNPFLKSGTLTANRIAPTGATASSSSFGQVASFANDADGGPSTQSPAVGWYGRWLSDTQAANPGDRYTLDVTLTPDSTVNGLSLTFAPQAGFSALPTSWTVYADRGSGFVNIGTFTPVGSRLHYYHDLGFGLHSVDALRLEVLESNVPSGLRLAVYEFEAFNLPEPGAMGLIGCVALLMTRRRR